VSGSLSAREARLLRSLAFQGRDLFTVSEAERVLGRDAGSVRVILHRLRAKGWLAHVARGRYRLIPLEAGADGHWAEHEFRIAATLTRPYYLAYATALAHYGYTERALHPVWIATTRSRPPREIDGVLYRFAGLAEHKFFGWVDVDILGTPVAIAEREKAVADGMDHPEYCGGTMEAAKGLWYGRDEMDLRRLVAYARRLGNRAAVKRLGFWLDRLGFGAEEALCEVAREDRSYPLLDPSGPRVGERDKVWRLIVNIPEPQLLEWREN
jgi:predicted transcriptional regulator of viral defense system